MMKNNWKNSEIRKTPPVIQSWANKSGRNLCAQFS